MEVSTTDPLKLVVMLYDGAISAIKRAIEHIELKDYMAKHKELMRAHDIIFELMACLDKERGGEVAQNLASLYTYMINRLMDANANLDIKTLNEVIILLTNLNDGWRELSKRGAEARPAEAATAPKPLTAARPGMTRSAKAYSKSSETATTAVLGLFGKEKVL
jgi:flagellar protein FliS